MKAFVTGATGFIGSHVASKLVERGYDVWAIARDMQSSGVPALEAQGIHVVAGDLGDPASLRAAMRDSDVVFHVAGWYKVGSRDRSQGQVVNVQGTRNVLSVARELGIPRVVYTSTVGVFGDTQGYLADESYTVAAADGGQTPDFLTEYERTKWLAHYQVAVPMMREGVPITIVMPGGVYGPGDTSILGELMRRFYLGQLPVVPGPESMLTYAHVDDIAEGHILAAERGRIGESYILAGPGLTLGEAVELWSDITGLPAPALRVPAALLRPAAPLVGALSKALPMPELYSDESIRTLGATYLATSAKARAELGWETRPLREGFAETFAWIDANNGPAPESWAARNSSLIAGIAVTSALAIVAFRAARRNRRKS